MNISKMYYNTCRGYITLVSVLIIGFVGVAVVVSVLLFGLSASQNSFAFNRSVQAQMLAEACIEEALQQVRTSASFSGTGNVAMDAGSCSYTVVDQGGESRAITAVGNVGAAVRKVKVIIDSINPQINIVSWQEVADF